MPRDLTGTATGQQHHEASVPRKLVSVQVFFSREFPPHHRGERMTYICSVHSMVPKPRFFDRKDAEEPVHKFPDGFHSSLTPGPDLRCDQVKNGHLQALQVARETE